MEPDEILARLDTPYASYQWEAMDTAVEQQAALTPLLLERLESAAADPEALLDMEGSGLLYNRPRNSRSAYRPRYSPKVYSDSTY